MPLAVLGAWRETIPLADALRVDEYLQSTRLAVVLERVDVEIDLTAGVAKASEVFGWIDTNRDGEISSAEGEAYAREMLRAVLLKADGRPMPVTLVESIFPQFREMSLGVGTIRLRATAKIPHAGSGRHEISFLNTHRSESSVYLVNALVPADARIQLGDQRRDSAQHGLTLDYTVMADASPAWTFVLLAGLTMAVWLFMRCGYAFTQAVTRRVNRGERIGSTG